MKKDRAYLDPTSSRLFFTIDECGIIIYNAVMRGLESDSKRGARESRSRLIAWLKSMGMVDRVDDLIEFGIAIDCNTLEKGITLEVREDAQG